MGANLTWNSGHYSAKPLVFRIKTKATKNPRFNGAYAAAKAYPIGVGDPWHFGTDPDPQIRTYL
jgi:hypothetical protein